MFVGFFQGAEKTMVKTAKNRPGKNRFWTGFFHLGGKKDLEKIGFGRVFSAVLEKIPFFRPKREHCT